MYVAVTERQATLTQVFSYGIVYLHFYEIKSCFAISGKNSKIQNGRHFWGGENFFKLPRVEFSDTLWVENFDKIALSRTVKKIEANVFCHFWQKFENSKWSPFLRRGKFFKNCQEYNAQIPCGRKF